MPAKPVDDLFWTDFEHVTVSVYLHSIAVIQCTLIVVCDLHHNILLERRQSELRMGNHREIDDAATAAELLVIYKRCYVKTSSNML